MRPNQLFASMPGNLAMCSRCPTRNRRKESPSSLTEFEPFMVKDRRAMWTKDPVLHWASDPRPDLSQLLKDHSCAAKPPPPTLDRRLTSTLRSDQILVVAV